MDFESQSPSRHQDYVAVLGQIPQEDDQTQYLVQVPDLDTSWQRAGYSVATWSPGDSRSFSTISDTIFPADIIVEEIVKFIKS